MNKRAQKTYCAFLFSISGFLLLTNVTQASPNAQTPTQLAATVKPTTQDTQSMLQALDSDFQAVYNEYLQEYSQRYPAKNFESTNTLIRALKDEPNDIGASNIIRKNLTLVGQNISSGDLSFLLGRLYSSNDTATVRDITHNLNKKGAIDKTSQNYFLLSKYYFDRSNWQGVSSALTKVEPSQLSVSDAQYYLLLKGYALQGQKMHRKAVPFYQKISSNSPYYAYARLNEGTAYLRQGWWTEAHMEFGKAIDALTENPPKDDSDLVNRIIVTLGFSQIHYEFFRDARATLRKVALDSEYTNKAMMGLGIAAAHQKDFPGALNIFELLLKKQPRDKNVDEAYLLVPFGYEELNDAKNASIRYQQAIQYYQMRLTEIEKASQSLKSSADAVLTETIKGLNTNSKELFDTPDVVPTYFLHNYSALLNMQKIALNPKISASVDSLLNRYKHELKTLVAHNIDVRRATLTSYLSQAKFGVAKLYDQE